MSVIRSRRRHPVQRRFFNHGCDYSGRAGRLKLRADEPPAHIFWLRRRAKLHLSRYSRFRHRKKSCPSSPRSVRHRAELHLAPYLPFTRSHSIAFLSFEEPTALRRKANLACDGRPTPTFYRKSDVSETQKIAFYANFRTGSPLETESSAESRVVGMRVPPQASGGS